MRPDDRDTIFGISMLVLAVVSATVLVIVYDGASAGPDSPVLTFSEDGLYDRGLAVDLPQEGASVDCGVSRRNEYRISESVFLYNETSCSTGFSVGDRGLSVNSSGVEVLFKALDSAGEFQVGYDFGDSGLVCNVSAGDQSERADDRYPAECSGVDGELYEEWNNESFKDFNVVERGQDALENQSSE